MTKQDEAILALARAVHGLASECGKSSFKGLESAVLEILEPAPAAVVIVAEAPVVSDEPKSKKSNK